SIVLFLISFFTHTSYLRHTAHVNISLCLLIADLCFLASSQPKGISDLWCRTSVVLKHFCFLAMFFWMFCLSATLLHRAVFLFHKVSKKNYLRFSLLIGYVCPLLIVFITFLTNNGGAEGMYYSKDSCWLVYAGLFKGSIFTFIIPVGVIVFINIFSMLVVIMKLISHHAEISKKTDISAEEEKAAAKTVLRTVVLLTPIFGVTWIFGFAMLALDLTSGDIAYAVNYIFNLLNGFQYINLKRRSLTLTKAPGMAITTPTYLAWHYVINVIEYKQKFSINFKKKNLFVI
uniref:G-protein coupled receptors family 2 profile 2 domain-containing protein n=1 Tax=Cyprinodon variegatus TaxID=28743 RepID=A0A3Q2GNM2_CYPVA